MGRYEVIDEADRKRRRPNIVPRKADGKARIGSQLRESREIAIFGPMSSKPNETNGQSRPEAPSPAGTQENASEGAAATKPKRPREIGGPKGPEPTRYGDWEFNGRCTDF
jgi:hypothetical protein